MLLSKLAQSRAVVHCGVRLGGVHLPDFEERPAEEDENCSKKREEHVPWAVPRFGFRLFHFALMAMVLPLIRSGYVEDVVDLVVRVSGKGVARVVGTHRAAVVNAISANAIEKIPCGFQVL